MTPNEGLEQLLFLLKIQGLYQKPFRFIVSARVSASNTGKVLPGVLMLCLRWVALSDQHLWSVLGADLHLLHSVLANDSSSLQELNLKIFSLSSSLAFLSIPMPNQLANP